MREKKREILKNALSDIKFKDAGIKISKKEMTNLPVVSDNINYPSLYLNAQNAPQLVGYEVGDEVVLVIKGKIMSHSKDDRVGQTKRETFDISIKKIGCQSKTK